MLLDKLGFIAIEGFECGNPEQKSKYATTLQQLIRDLDEQEPCGWIVDLHENTGGNKWPMLAGLGPIVGEREVGACIDPDGHKEIWSYRDGQAPAGEYIRTQVNGPAVRSTLCGHAIHKKTYIFLSTFPANLAQTFYLQ